MKRQRGIRAALGVGLIGAAIGIAGCGSGGGTSLGASTGTVRTSSFAGKLVADPGTSLAGTVIVAEQLVGGRTATVRAIIDLPDDVRRSDLVQRVQSGARSAIEGIYTTTAMADGSYLFRDLPAGEYSLMARRGDMVAILPEVTIGGPRTSAPRVMRLAAVGTVNGKIRYAHPNEQNPDNSGILAFIKGTSLVGFTTGTSRDYSIPNVPDQAETDSPYVIGAIAAGFADDEIALRERLVGQTAMAPLIFLRPGALLSGRVSDPTITQVDRQGLGTVQIVAITGQSARTDGDGLFTMRGLPEGSNFLTLTRTGYRTLRLQLPALTAGVNSHQEITLQRS